MKILLVDDVRLFLELEKTFLRRLECDLLTAASGEEALEIVGSEHPALVLLDDQMPGIGGLEACRRIKADPALTSTVVLMASSPDLEAEARAAGADAFIAKPLGQSELAAVVRRLVPALQPRRNERAFLRLEVEASGEGSPVRGWTRDLSATGLFFLTTNPLRVGTRMRLRFRLPGTEAAISVQAEVRNAVLPGAAGHLSPGVGVLFHGLPAADASRISEFVRRVESGSE